MPGVRPAHTPARRLRTEKRRRDESKYRVIILRGLSNYFIFSKYNEG